MLLNSSQNLPDDAPSCRSVSSPAAPKYAWRAYTDGVVQAPAPEQLIQAGLQRHPHHKSARSPGWNSMSCVATKPTKDRADIAVPLPKPLRSPMAARGHHF